MSATNTQIRWSAMGSIKALSIAIFIIELGCSPYHDTLEQPVGLLPTTQSIQTGFINERCLSCHSDSTEHNRHVNLTDIKQITTVSNGGHSGHLSGHARSPIIRPGCPKQSLVVSILREGQMPPPPSAPIDAKTIEIIETWIRSLNPDDKCLDDEPGDGIPDGDEPGT